MYQGATTGGQSRSTTPKKRRRSAKKKNPSPMVWVALAGGTAVVVGSTVAVVMYRRKKKLLLPGNGNGQLPTGPGPGPGKKPPKEVIAPEPPFSLSEAKALEAQWATVVVFEQTEEGTVIPLSKIEGLTDKAFAEIYGSLDIPRKSRRGAEGSKNHKNWHFYTDSWMRIRKTIRDVVEAWNAGVSGA